jgi:hypothetical protein
MSSPAESSEIISKTGRKSRTWINDRGELIKTGIKKNKRCLRLRKLKYRPRNCGK